MVLAFLRRERLARPRQRPTHPPPPARQRRPPWHPTLWKSSSRFKRWSPLLRPSFPQLGRSLPMRPRQRPRRRSVRRAPPPTAQGRRARHGARRARTCQRIITSRTRTRRLGACDPSEPPTARWPRPALPRLAPRPISSLPQPPAALPSLALPWALPPPPTEVRPERSVRCVLPAVGRVAHRSVGRRRRAR